MAMVSLFVVIVAVAITQPASATQPAAEPSCSATQDQKSLLSNMLLMTGYSQACVATALDVCSSSGKSPYASLIEEAREVVVQVSAAVAKWDSQLSAGVNSIESQVSTALNSIESQVSTAINSIESEVSTAINSIESEVSTVVNSIESQVSNAVNKSESLLSTFMDKSESYMNKSESELSAFMNKSESLLSAFKNTSESLPRHCRDLHASGDSGRGTRQVYPDPARPLHSVTVVCDHTVDGGGWTVFQRRTSDAQRQDFRRTWREYEDGFGDKDGGEFWLGLKVLHQLTSTGLHQLRIDLHDYEGEHRWAKYGHFSVSGPETNYRLNVAQYSGDAGDSLRYHNSQTFSTHDADHDIWIGNCAAEHKAGWWYSNCLDANLNGYQHVGSDSPRLHGIIWGGWRGYEYSLKKTTMMTRPA